MGERRPEAVSVSTSPSNASPLRPLVGVEQRQDDTAELVRLPPVRLEPVRPMCRDVVDVDGVERIEEGADAVRSCPTSGRPG